MPTYVSKCNSCGTEHEFVRKIADRDRTPECCGVSTVRGLVAPQISAMAFTGHKGFHMPDGEAGGRGTWIEDGHAYKRYLKEKKKLPASEGAAEAERARKNAKAADDKKRREAVVEAFKKLST